MKSRYIHFTDAQKQAAKQTDLVSFLQSRGEKKNVQVVNMNGLGTITIRGNQFYDHYEQRGGWRWISCRNSMDCLPQAVQLC